MAEWQSDKVRRIVTPASHRPEEETTGERWDEELNAKVAEGTEKRRGGKQWGMVDGEWGMKNRKSAFTLAELMVVIVIMALLLFLALPAFQGIGRGSKLQTAAFQLRTALTLARQMAITQRRVVSMILPSERPELYQGDGAGHIDKALRAYAPYSYRDGYLAEWKYLPPGVLFDPSFRPMSSVQNVFQYTDFYTNVPFAVSGSAIKSLPSVRFRPDGLTGGSDIVGIYLTEGVIEGLIPIFRTNSTVLSLDIVAVTGRIISREHLPTP